VVRNSKRKLNCEGYSLSRYDNVEYSEPVLPRGREIAQRIKGTLGITGSSPLRDHIDGEVWHLDVDSTHPGGEAAPKGTTVRSGRSYVNWVQTIVR